MPRWSYIKAIDAQKRYWPCSLQDQDQDVIMCTTIRPRAIVSLGKTKTKLKTKTDYQDSWCEYRVQTAWDREFVCSIVSCSSLPFFWNLLKKIHSPFSPRFFLKKETTLWELETLPGSPCTIIETARLLERHNKWQDLMCKTKVTGLCLRKTKTKSKTTLRSGSWSRNVLITNNHHSFRCNHRFLAYYRSFVYKKG